MSSIRILLSNALVLAFSSVAGVIACSAAKAPDKGPAAPQPAAYQEGSACHAGNVFGGAPSDVHTNDACGFYEFAWADFLSLLAPSDGRNAPIDAWKSKEQVFDKPAHDETLAHCSKAVEGDRLIGRAIAQPHMAGAAFPSDPVQINFTLTPLNAQPARGGAGMKDEPSRWVFFETRLNEVADDYVEGCGLESSACFDSFIPPAKDVDRHYESAKSFDFPSGSITLKAAWRVIQEGDKARYYWISAFAAPTRRDAPTSCAKETLGLVGLHVVHKTPNHPEWIWQTFEHIDNMPECDPASPSKQRKAQWSFHDPSCKGAACDENVYASGCTGDTACGACGPGGRPENFYSECKPGEVLSFSCGADDKARCNMPATCWGWDPGIATGNAGASYGFAADKSCCFNDDPTKKCATVPTQACRAYPVGYRKGAPVDKRLDTLNGDVQAAIDKLGPSDPRSKLKNYFLVGAEWFEPTKAHAGATGRNDPRVELDVCTPGEADAGKCAAGEAKNERSGDTMLANGTLETFIQGAWDPSLGTKGGGGCFYCHKNTYQGRGGLKGPFDGARRAGFSHLFSYMHDEPRAASRDACVVKPGKTGCPSQRKLTH